MFLISVAAVEPQYRKACVLVYTLFLSCITEVLQCVKSFLMVGEVLVKREEATGMKKDELDFLCLHQKLIWEESMDVNIAGSNP